MTKFQNSKFSVGPKPGEKLSDIEWEIAVGLRCPKCTSKFAEGSLDCTNPLCGVTVLAEQLDEAAPVLTWDELVQAEYAEGMYDKLPYAIASFDGGSSNNPGIGAWAFALEYPDRTTMTQIGKIGVVTNNEAEYLALINLLEYALDHGVKKIHIKGDSKLVVEQVNGNWKVKSDNLKSLAAKARELAQQFEEFALFHIPREDNTECDALVKDAIKEQKEEGKE